MNDLQAFESQYLQAFIDLKATIKAKKELEATEKSIRAVIEEAFDKHDIKSLDNDLVKITRVEGSTTKSIDLKKMQKLEESLYEELLADYPKTSIRKPYIKITFK